MDWRRDAVNSITDLCVPRLSRKKRDPDSKLFYNFGQDIFPLLADAHIQVTWDFNLCIGDTIKEKYETLYAEVADISACLRGFVLKDEGQIGDGDGWIITCPEIASIFETASGYYPTGGLMYEEDCIYAGDIDRRWRLLKNDSMNKHALVVGCGMPPTKPTKYRVGVIVVENLIA
jgi:hypothetical protein